MFDFAMKMFVQFGNVYTEDCTAICAGNGMGTVGGGTIPPNNMMVPQIPQQQICSCYPVGYTGGGVPPAPGYYPPQPVPQYPAYPTYTPPNYTPPTNSAMPPAPPKKSTTVECNTSTLVMCTSIVEDVPAATVLPPPAQQPSMPVYVAPPVPVMPVMPVYQQPTPTYQQPTYQQPNYQQPTYQQPTYQQPVGGTGTGQTTTPGYVNVSGGKQFVSSDCLSNCTIGENYQQTKQVKIQKPTQIVIENQQAATTGTGCVCVPPTGSIGGSIGGGGGGYAGSVGSAEMCVVKSEHNVYEDCLSNGGIDYETVGNVQIPRMNLTPTTATNISCVC